MADIAELGLKVDGTQVAAADVALDKLAEAAVNAEAAAKRLASTTQTEHAKIARAAKDSSDAHVSAYRNQQAASDRYLQSLRNEIATLGKTRAEIEAVRSAQAGLTAEQQRAAVAMGAQIDQLKAQQGAMGTLQQAAMGLGVAYTAAFAVRGVVDFTKAMFDASVNAQRLRTTLDFATGGNGAKELQYVTQFAERLGLQLDSTAKAYASMQAAAKGTSLEGEGARKVFESVAKASTVMGLSAEQNSGALLALQQMISKGTVQSEELRGQLGERLPGAFQIAARAMGVTTAELGKMLEQGLVPASEFLPKFAAQLEKELGGAADAAANRLDAAVNRFDNAWERLKRAGGDAGVAKGFAETTNFVAGGMNEMADTIERMSRANTLGEWINALLTPLDGLARDIEKAREEVRLTDEQLAKAPKNIYFQEASANARAYLADLRALQAEQLALSGSGTVGGGRGSVNPQTIAQRGAAEAAAKERADELKSYLERNATLSKTQIIEKEITAAKERAAKMTAKNASDTVAAAQIEKALQQEISNIREKHKPKGGGGAAAAARDEVNAELEEFKRGQQVQEEIARRSIANISVMRRDGYLSAEDAARAVFTVETELNSAAITALEMQIDAVSKRKNSAKEVAALNGQIAVQREKQLTREVQLEQQISDIVRERAEQNERRHRDAENESQRELTSLEESNKRMREDIELIGLTEEAKQRVIDARMAHTIALQRERVETLRSISVSEKDNQTLDLEEAKLRELTEARELYNESSNRERLDKDVTRMQEAYDDWFRGFTGDISSGVADAIISGGEGSGEKLRKTLQDALLRKPLTAVINAGVNAVMSGVFGAIGSAFGVGGGVGGGGGGGGLLSLASNASSLYNGAGTLYNMYGAASAYMGIGNSAAAAYLSHPLAGIAANGSVPALATSSAGATLGGGTAASGAAPGAAGGMGAWGAGGVAAAIMLAVINVLGGMRSETMIGSGLAGKLGGKDSLTPWEEWREGGTLLDGSSFSTGNPLEVLKEQRRRLQEERDAGRGESNYAVALQATVTSLEKSTKGLATQTAIFDREIQKGYKSYRSNVVDMANSLGLAGESVKDFVYEIGAQDLNFKDLKPEEIQAKIEETFGKAGKGMAELLLGSMKEVTETIVNTWADTTDPENVQYTTETTVNKRMEYEASVYANVGETALDTLTRLSTAMRGFNDVSDALGFGIQDVSLAAADAADKFIEAAGGLERVARTSASFIDAYYSDDKKREALARSGAREAERIGLKGITAEGLLGATPDQILEGVNSLASNPELYFDAQDWAVSIRGLWDTAEKAEPAVKDLSEAIDELTQMYTGAVKSLKSDANSLAVEELRARGDEAGADALARQQYLDSFVDSKGQKLDETRLKEIATLYDANEATRARIKAIKEEEEASKKAITRQREMVERMNNAAIASTDKWYAEAQRWIGIERGLLEETATSARAVVDVLHSSVQELYRSVDSSANGLGMLGSDFIAQALATARATGVLPDADKLGDAIGDVRNSMDKQVYGSKFESERARLILAGNLAQLEEMADDQLTDAEKQLEVLKQMEAAGEELLHSMRGTEGYAKSMAEALKGLVTAYNTEAAVRAANAGKLVGGGSAYYDVAAGIGQNDEGVKFDVEGIRASAAQGMKDGATPAQIWDWINGSGFSMEQANAILGLDPGTIQNEAVKAGLPIFHNGTAFVPRTGLALLERGEQVVTKGRNPAFAGMGGVRADEAAAAVMAQAQNDALDRMAATLSSIDDAVNGNGRAPARVRLSQDQLSQIGA